MRPRRVTLRPHVESLETRQMLHGGPASEPRAIALKLVEQELAAAQHHHAQARAQAARAAAHPVQRAALERALHAQAVRHHGAAVHAEVIGRHKAHKAKHHPAQHKAKHHKAKQHRAAAPAAATATVLAASAPTAAFPNPSIVATAAPAAATVPADAVAGTAAPVAAPAALSVPTITAPTSALAVGGDLETTIVPGGIAGPGVSYLITPQPLPANMTFDRTTGALSFRPAPGQEGHYQFTITAQGGLAKAAVVVPIAVSRAAEATTEVSGRVVDEDGLPLAGMPVAVGTSTATTDLLGRFTLTGLPAEPGPISVGGAVADAQSRQGLYAPLDQIMGRELFADANNVIAQPLILPRINWSGTASFAGAVAAAGGLASSALALTNPAMPGFALSTVPGVSGAVSPAGWSRVAQLGAAVSAQHQPEGAGGGMFLLSSKGINLSKPVMLSLPNSGHLQPGAIIGLTKLNVATGGHDVVGDMVVSPDGVVLTSLAPMILGHEATSAAPHSQSVPNDQVVHADDDPADTPDNVACLIPEANGGNQSPNFVCKCGTFSGNGVATPPNTGNGGPGLAPGPVRRAFDSDADLVSGDYRLDHMTVAYQSQGQSRDVNLAYSSLQADPRPVVEWQLAIPQRSNASSITSVTAQVTLGGVTQGPPVTFSTPGGLSDGMTYNVPVQVDATALATGAYPYQLKITVNYGSSAGAGATSFTTVNEGFVNVVNRSGTPLGAGWSIDGLQQIAQAQAGAPVLVNEGQVGTTRFDPVYANGGSYQDLAVSNTTAGATISGNDGRGDFAPTAISQAGSATVATVAGDFDGDGKPDLAIAGPTGLVLRANAGGGTLAAAGTINLPTGYTARAMAAGNFTGHSDGTLDLAVVLASTSTDAYAVAVYAGAGNGTFAAPVVSQAGNGIASGSATSPPNTVAVGDFDGDGRPDLAFTTDDGLVDIMLAGAGGAFGAASALTLPAQNQAIGVTATDYNADGHADLVVEVVNSTVLSGNQTPLMGLVAYRGTGSGTFAAQGSPYISNGFNNAFTVGLVAGDFNGADAGLEVAVPVASAEGDFVDIVPLSPSGAFGAASMLPSGDYAGPTYGNGRAEGYGNIVAGDFDGAGRPSIALSDGTDQVQVLLADTDSNSILGDRSVTFAGGSNDGTGTGGGGLQPVTTGPGDTGQGEGMTSIDVGMLAVGAFVGTVAVPGLRGTPSETSSIVHDADGTWTRSYPDGTVVRFDTQGREVSETDRNGNATTYTYVPAGQPGAGALQTMTDPVGLVTTLAYGGGGTLQTITDPAGRVTGVVVDGNGNLTRITDPDGAIYGYGYNSTLSNHLATTETDADDQTATAHYNAFGQLASETLFGGATSTQIAPAQAQDLMAPGQTVTGLPTYVSTLTDADGRTMTIEMNRGSHPTQVIDPANISDYSTYTYTTRGFVAGATDEAGRKTSYTYDGQGNVTSITEPAPGELASQVYGPGYSDAADVAATETIAYDDPYGVPTSITDFLGHATTFTLDPRGNVLRRTDPDGLHEDWTYNAAGQPLTDTSRAGNTTSYAYDTKGRLVTITDPGPSSTGSGSPHVGMTYDTAGDLLTLTDERGDTTTYTYDQAGRVLTTQDAVQAAHGTATHDAYDPDGNPLSTTDALGHVTSYTYTARDQVATMTDPVHQGTNVHASYGYDGVGNLASMTDLRGYATTYTYDGNNRTTSVTDAASEETDYNINGAGDLISTDDPRHITTTYSYDGRGDLFHENLPALGDPNGPSSFTNQGAGFTTELHDADGNTLSVTVGLTGVNLTGQTTTYAYNSLNQLIGTTDPLGHTTGTTYDADLNTATTTDGLGHATTYTYDARDRLVSRTDPDGGGTTSYTYDDANNLLSVTDPDDNVTRYTYDAANRVATETSPTQGVTTYTYDDAGNLVRKVDADNRTIQYGYDADDRETSETWLPAGGGSPIYAMTLTYDADGDVATVQDNYSQYTYTYDTVDRPTGVDNSGTPGSPRVALTYGYDADGNRTSLSDSLGGTDTYGYNLRNQLDLVSQSGSPSSGVDPELAYMQYDQVGGLIGLSRYADLDANTPVGTTTYSYDQAERLTGIAHADANGDTIASYGYTLDAANRLTSLTHAWDGGTATDTVGYGYTDNDQLTSVTHTNPSLANESFSYDQNGNRNASGQATGTGNEIQSDGTYNYAYDPAGNLLSKTSIATGVQTTYVWDYRNRLVEVDSISGGTTTVLARFIYDALDRQIGEVDDPVGVAPAPSLGDAGFESANVGLAGYVYDPSDTAWSFAGDAGVSGNDTAFTAENPAAPAGSQVAFVQKAGSLSQSVTFAAAGTYTLSALMAQRGNYGASNQSVDVLIDGQVVGTLQMSGTSYQPVSTAAFAVSAGAHTITLRGVATSDQTALLDSVALAGTAAASSGGASSVRWTVYDGQTPLLDFDGSGHQTARYLSVPGAIDELLARQTSSGVVWYLDDREGSVGDLINSAGTVLDHVDYTPYGQVAAPESAPAQGDRFKYAGMEYYAAIALYYDRARYYDPTAGRFEAKDPTGFDAGDANLYRYVDSSPTNFVDLNGLAQDPRNPGPGGNQLPDLPYRPTYPSLMQPSPNPRPGDPVPGTTPRPPYPGRPGPRPATPPSPAPVSGPAPPDYIPIMTGPYAPKYPGGPGAYRPPGSVNGYCYPSGPVPKPKPILKPGPISTPKPPAICPPFVPIRIPGFPRIPFRW